MFQHAHTQKKSISTNVTVAKKMWFKTIHLDAAMTMTVSDVRQRVGKEWGRGGGEN